MNRVQRLWGEGRKDAAMHYEGFRQWRRHLASLGVDSLAGQRVLDIGCGDRAALSLLFALHGAHVSAVDVLPVHLGRRRPLMWARLMVESGIGSASRQIARDVLHTWRYWRHLRRVASVPALPFDSVSIHKMNAENLDFPDSTFSVVASAAVWEHIRDVVSATREVNRVLAADGLACIQIAMFPSLQGGHHAEWHSTDPDPRRTIKPWDHLRVDARPLPLYCNSWRESQFRDVFEREMIIVEWESGEMRGEEYLTSAVRGELPDYSERDLLLPYVTAWARKRTPESLSSSIDRRRRARA